MDKALRVTLCCLIVICPLCSLADDVPDIRKQIIDGNEFSCFTQSDSLQLLQMRLDLPKLNSKIYFLEAQIAIKDEQISVINDANINLTKQANVLAEQSVEQQQKISHLDSWYRNPYFLVLAGMVAGFGGAVTIYYTAK